MKVLIVGHACGPGMGSEPGNTWQLARRMAERNDVWLIAHPQYRELVEQALQESSVPKLRILWVTVESIFDRWKPEEGESGIRFHYVLWLKRAYREAQRLHKQVGFDVLHHASWGTVGAAPPFGELDVPVVWGPLGGAQTTPHEFLTYFGNDARNERIRTLYVNLRRFSPSLRRGVRKVALHLTVNRETERLLRKMGAGDVRRFLDCGLERSHHLENPRSLSAGNECTLLWAGRLEHRKGLPLALEAMARTRHLPVTLNVAGQGPEAVAYQKLVDDLQLNDRVVFLGQVPFEEMPNLFRRADAFVFTSLRDSFGSVVLEAMSYALPLIMLDHQGVGAFVPDEAAVKVAVNNPAQVVEDMAAGIEKLVTCQGSRLRMGSEALNMANQNTWDQRVAQINALYQEVISAHRGI